MNIKLCVLMASFCISSPVFSQEAKNIVTYENFPNVESTKQIDRYQNLAGGVNKWLHFQTPTPIDKQPTIRMNRDTLYSFAVIDVSKGAVVTLPDSGDRYMSLMLVDEKGYTNQVWYGKGSYTLTNDIVGSDYALALVRTFVDSNNADDVKKVNELQDALKIESQSKQAFKIKDWDESSYKPIYSSLLDLFKLLPNARYTFGSPDEVDPIRFILGAAGGYAGLPSKDAFYMNVSPSLDVGRYQLQIRDVPVDGFWSFSLYNSDGYFFKSKYGLSNINSVTASPNKDGSYTIYFGGCETRLTNCLALEDGWNFVARFYQPKKALLDGSWILPAIQESK